MPGPLNDCYNSINSLSRSLGALAAECTLVLTKYGTAADPKQAFEMRSLEIAADALEILVRALELDNGHAAADASSNSFSEGTVSSEANLAKI
jgi:hypothetical protein